MTYLDAVQEIATKLATRKAHRYLGGAMDPRIDSDIAGCALAISTIFPTNDPESDDYCEAVFDIESAVNRIYPSVLKAIK